MRAPGYLFIPFLFLSCSFFTTRVAEEKELHIGVPATTLKLATEGSDLIKYINTRLLTDSSRNLLSQLGSYKFSTSIDASNAIDSRYNPDVFIYYDYEGLQLRYVFKGAGLLQRSELQYELENYKKSIYLEQIIFEAEAYKGRLPYDLSKHFGPLSVEKVIGKHNSFFDSGDPNSRTTFTYPEKGLFITFTNNLSNNTIQYITLSDSISEMKRYPTIYSNYASK